MYRAHAEDSIEDTKTDICTYTHMCTLPTKKFVNDTKFYMEIQRI